MVHHCYCIIKTRVSTCASSSISSHIVNPATSAVQGRLLATNHLSTACSAVPALSSSIPRVITNNITSIRSLFLLK